MLKPLPASAKALLRVELFCTCATALGHSAMLLWLSQHATAAGLVTYGALLAATTLLGMPVLSPLGDRIQKPVLIRLGHGGLLVLAALQCAIACWCAEPVAPLTVIGMLATLAQAMAQPAQQAWLPDLLPATQLADAIRRRRGLQALGSLTGPVLAGAAVSWGSPLAGLVLHAFLSAVCTAAALLLRSPAPPAPSRPSPTPWLQLLRAGWRAKWHVQVDRWWTLSGALMMMFYSPAVGLLLPLRLNALQAPTAWFGLCQGSLAAGVLFGVLGASETLIRRLGRHRAMILAVVVCGVCICGMSVCTGPASLAALLALMGACTSITQLTGQTVRALAVPDDFRARMTAAQLTVTSLAGTAAPMVAGAMLQRWPIGTVYALQGVAFLVAGLLLLVVPGLRTLLSLSASEAVGWYERRYPEAFRRDASPNRHRCP